MTDLVYLKNVSTLKLDKDKCSGCSMCITVCPHRVFKIIEKKADICNIDLCMECGACQKNCPEGAINVQNGVGCAAGIIMGYLKGTEPTCSCESGACC